MGAPRDPFGLVGETIAEKYRVDRVIGEGGFGVVYEGLHQILDTRIAIKCLKPLGEASDDAARTTEAFLREAKLLFTLTHPAIVRLYDIGTVDAAMQKVPYVVLELLEGRSLEAEIDARRLENRQFDARALEAIILPVTEALAFAHGIGVSHRDLKPSNVMLLEGGAISSSGAVAAKVVDFGVARWVGEQRASAGLSGFTPRYAAPEQWDSTFGAIGPSCDVFALGLVIAEMCTLVPVHGSTSPAQIFAAALKREKRVDLVAARPDLPSSIDAIVERATKVDQADRYASAIEMLDDLRLAFGRSATRSSRKEDLSSARTVLARDAGATPVARVVVSSPPPGRTADPLSASLHASRTSRVSLYVAVAASIAALCALVGLFLVRREPSTIVVAPPAVAPSTSSPIAPSPSIAVVDAAPNVVSATVTMTPIFVPGTYTQKKIDALTAMHAHELRACYLDSLSRDAASAGTVSIFVSIEATGAVYAVNDIDSSLDEHDLATDVALRACLLGSMRRWKFPSDPRVTEVNGVLFIVDLRSDAPPVAIATDHDLDGAWTSVAKSKDGTIFKESFAIAQRGRRLLGDYTDGAMACAVDEAKLLCVWTQLDSAGRAVFTRTSKDRLDGTWGIGPSDSDGGPWNCNR